MIIAPNPSLVGSPINIQLNSTENFMANIRVLNMQGQLVSTITEQPINLGDNTITIPTQNLSAGMYWINIQSDKGMLTQKFIVTQ
jgi:hypothetical protein